MQTIQDFLAPFIGINDRATIQLCGFLLESGATHIVVSELSSSDQFLIETIQHGSQGANWEVIYTNDSWSVAGMPETNVWFVRAHPGEGAYPYPLVALG